MSSFRWPRRARLLSVLGYVGGCGLSVCFLWAGASVIINSLIGHDNKTDLKHRGTPPSYHSMLEKTVTAVSVADPPHLREILSNILIPRVVGTPSHTKVREYIIEQLSSYGWSVTTDEFSDKTPNFGYLTFSNIIARLNPSAKQYVVLACHYDSKYFPNMVFLGATDSAAPCAMLIYLAKTLQKELSALKNTDLSLELWFFDGEEAFVDWGPLDSIYGARHLAMKMEQEQTLSQIKCLILLDLLGSKNPVMHNYYNEQELYKHFVASEKALRSGGHLTSQRTLFRTESVNHLVEDDHIPFLRRNVPIIHWIPRQFPDVWHTSADNESVLDWSSLEDMSKVLRLFVLRYFNL